MNTSRSFVPSTLARPFPGLRSLPFLLAATLVVSLMPPGSALAQDRTPGPQAPLEQRMPELPHLSFAVGQDILVNASPATILSIFQDPRLWSPNLAKRTHLGGPVQGVGAYYAVETKTDGQTMTRRERTIIADDKRVVLHILSDPPTKATTFVELSALAEGGTTRATFKIYVDAEMASEVPTSMLPTIVQGNEAVLAGHLQRIKALAEQPGSTEKFSPDRR
jgi:hypothetical protein